MSLSSKKCCVPGCMESGGMTPPLHLLPNPVKDKQRFNDWVFAIRGDIIGMDDNDIYKHRRICHKHFEKKFWCRHNKLSIIALPTLHLPGPLSLPKFTFAERRPPRQKQNVSSEPIPSTSRTHAEDDVRRDHDYLKRKHEDHSYTQVKILEKRPSMENELSNLPSHRSDDMHHTSSHKVAVSISGNLQNESSTTETDSIVYDAIDDEGTDPPELEDSIDRPFTWQKQAITCADDENTNVVGNEPELIHESKGSQNEQSMLVDLETVLECEEEEQEHGGYRCNECAGDIVGFRYLCVQCADYDVCAACEARGAHAHHYALRVPSRKPRDEVQRVIEAIQKCINDDPSLIFLPADDSVKIEVKNEDEEQPNETECESDPLMVPTVQSLRDEETTRQVPVLEQDPLRSSNVEHADRTARGRLSKNIQDKHFNQQFLFNSSSVPDTGQDYSEVYYLSSLSSDDPESIFSHIEVDDRNCLNDDISNPTNSVEESDGQSTLELFSSTTQETESNVKLKLSNATNYLTKDISDLMCIKSKNLLVKLNRLDMNKLGVFTERRLKNIKNRSTIKR